MANLFDYLVCICFGMSLLLFDQPCEASIKGRFISNKQTRAIEVSNQVSKRSTLPEDKIKMSSNKWDEDDLTPQEYDEAYDELADYFTENDYDGEKMETSEYDEEWNKELDKGETLTPTYEEKIEKVMKIFAGTLLTTKYFDSCSTERKIGIMLDLFKIKEKIKRNEKPKSRAEGKFFHTIKTLRNFPKKDLLRIFHSVLSSLE